MVLLCVSPAKADMSENAFFGAIDAGATWASAQIFGTDAMRGKAHISGDKTYLGRGRGIRFHRGGAGR